MQTCVWNDVGELAHGRGISRGRSTFMSGALMHDCIKDEHISQQQNVRMNSRM